MTELDSRTDLIERNNEIEIDLIRKSSGLLTVNQLPDADDAINHTKSWKSGGDNFRRVLSNPILSFLTKSKEKGEHQLSPKSEKEVGGCESPGRSSHDSATQSSSTWSASLPENEFVDTSSDIKAVPFSPPVSSSVSFRRNEPEPIVRSMSSKSIGKKTGGKNQRKLSSHLSFFRKSKDKGERQLSVESENKGVEFGASEREGINDQQKSLTHGPELTSNVLTNLIDVTNEIEVIPFSSRAALAATWQRHKQEASIHPNKSIIVAASPQRKSSNSSLLKKKKEKAERNEAAESESPGSILNEHNTMESNVLTGLVDIKNEIEVVPFSPSKALAAPWKQRKREASIDPSKSAESTIQKKSSNPLSFLKRKKEKGEELLSSESGNDATESNPNFDWNASIPKNLSSLESNVLSNFAGKKNEIEVIPYSPRHALEASFRQKKSEPINITESIESKSSEKKSNPFAFLKKEKVEDAESSDFENEQAIQSSDSENEQAIQSSYSENEQAITPPPRPLVKMTSIGVQASPISKSKSFSSCVTPLCKPSSNSFSCSHSAWSGSAHEDHLEQRNELERTDEDIHQGGFSTPSREKKKAKNIFPFSENEFSDEFSENEVPENEFSEEEAAEFGSSPVSVVEYPPIAQDDFSEGISAAPFVTRTMSDLETDCQCMELDSLFSSALADLTFNDNIYVGKLALEIEEGDEEDEDEDWSHEEHNEEEWSCEDTDAGEDWSATQSADQRETEILIQRAKERHEERLEEERRRKEKKKMKRERKKERKEMRRKIRSARKAGQQIAMF